MDDSSIVLTQAAVVERRRQVLGSSTRTLVHSDHIEARTIGFRGDAAHIVRLAAAFKAVHEHHGLAGCAVWLPVTITEQLGVRLSGEKSRRSRDSVKERSARPIAWEHGHEMSIAEPGCRYKISFLW